MNIQLEELVKFSNVVSNLEVWVQSLPATCKLLEVRVPTGQAATAYRLHQACFRIADVEYIGKKY